MNDESVFLQLLILLLLVGLNAFFASSEVALISLKPTVRRRLLSRGGMRARALKALTDDSGRFLATVQIGVTLAGFLASAFAANAFSDPLTELLESLGITWISHGTLDKIVVVFITILLSYFSLWGSADMAALQFSKIFLDFKNTIIGYRQFTVSDR